MKKMKKNPLFLFLYSSFFKIEFIIALNMANQIY